MLLRALGTGALRRLLVGETNTQSGGSTSHQRLHQVTKTTRQCVCHGHHEGEAGGVCEDCTCFQIQTWPS